jgi:hypothetical protein
MIIKVREVLKNGIETGKTATFHISDLRRLEKYDGKPYGTIIFNNSPISVNVRSVASYRFMTMNISADAFMELSDVYEKYWS